MNESRIPWTLPVSQVDLYESLECRIFLNRNSLDPKERMKLVVDFDELYLVFPAPINRRTGAAEQFSIRYTLLPDARWPVLSDLLPKDILVFFVKEFNGKSFLPGKGGKVVWKQKFPYPHV